MTAITAETRIKNTMNSLMMKTCFFSVMSFFIEGLITSSVKVELEVSTSDESVDIEAASTSTITTAMMTEGSVESIVGTIVSNRGLPVEALYWILSA